jgi:hypothetical protein
LRYLHMENNKNQNVIMESWHNVQRQPMCMDTQGSLKGRGSPSHSPPPIPLP